MKNKFRILKLRLNLLVNKYFRTCASCEYTFIGSSDKGCPKCEFGTYATFYVYGVFTGIIRTILKKKKCSKLTTD
jgi:hypothetical protein